VTEWPRSRPEPGKDHPDIRCDSAHGIAKITTNRPEACHAFRPIALFELTHASNPARHDRETGVIILTGPAKMAFYRP
jgi:naphthoate synthase